MVLDDNVILRRSSPILRRTAPPTDRRRGGFALLTTVLLLTLLIATCAELTMLTSVGAVTGARRRRTLAHQLAVDSSLLLLADRLASVDGRESDLIRTLDQIGMAATTFEVGGVRVLCTLRDAAAKFNPRLFQRRDQRSRLVRKLSTLAVRRSLPTAKVTLKPVTSPSAPRGGTASPSAPVYHWYDQILTELHPGQLFRWDEEQPGSTPVWSDLVTLWGDGRIDLRRAHTDVLEAALEDIRPGLAKILLSQRPTDRTVNFMQSALIGVPAELRQRVTARITYNARRYAIQMHTSIGGDQRRWYLVAQIHDGTVSVLHRSQLTW